MKGTIDMTDTQEGGNYNLLPEGTYTFQITQIEDKVSKNGDPMILVTHAIIAGENSGSVVWDNIIFPELNSTAIKIKGRTKHFLHCIGEPYDNNLEWDSERWIGKSVTIRVFHEEHDNKVRAKVAEYILDEELNKQEKLPF